MRPRKSGSQRRGRPTIEDVAKKAGVSVMSVSRVLNNSAHVSARIGAQVKRAVHELNYVPNHAARRLAERLQSHNVAFLFGAPNALVLGEMVGAAFAEAAAAGAELVLIKLEGNRDLARVRRTLANLGIEGAVLAPPLCDDTGLRQSLSSAGIRIVAIGSDDRALPHSSVGIDDRRAAYQLTRHLLELGHRRIAFIGGPPRHRSSLRRREGHEAALVEYGLALDPALEWRGEYTYGSALAGADRALGMDPRPTAIFAANDDMAAAVMSVARSRGIRIPDALTVCGFDDSEIAVIVSPQLTTVSQPIGAMVRWAVRQLVQELAAIERGEEPEVHKVVLHHTIVQRETDAPPPDQNIRSHRHAGGGRAID